jgi:hypothetical protein
MSRYQPVLLGGAFIGVLSALPVVNLANCCCLWVIVGGVLTVYLQQQNSERPVETGEAAVAGLLAGLIGATIHIVGLAALSGLAGGVIDPQIQRALEDNPQVPPEVRDMVMRYMTGPGMLLIMAAISIPVYAVVGALGALLGLAFFKKNVPPPSAEA